MILLTARIIKVLLFFLVVMIGFLLFRKQLSLCRLLCFEILIVIFAIVANVVADFLPPLTDKVTLTALGECREEAKAEEVYLAGYTIDGNEFISGESLKIEEGHWFWSGETYCWRIETDTRQPKGVTRSVALRIPVGWERTLNFKGNDWRGMVQISVEDKTWIIDTYAKKDCIISESIGKSTAFVLILNQSQRLLLYTVIFVLLSSIALYIVQTALRNTDIFLNLIEKYSGRLICSGIAIITLLLMFHYAGLYPLWGDELHNVAFTNGTFKEALQYNLLMMEVSPPLPLFVQTIWYHIAPYGEKWLMLVSIVPTAISIYVIGRASERIFGKYGGILASLFMACSFTVWENVAYEYRSYPFLVLFSTLTLYSYILRNQHREDKKYIVFFSFFMTGMAMSHYFGMLGCACFFLGDIYLFYRKQISLCNIASYFIPGITSSVWLTMVWVSISKNGGIAGSVDWFSIPSIADIKNILMFLAGKSEIGYYILIIGVSITILWILKRKQLDFRWEVFYSVFSVAIIMMSIGVIFLYGTLISTRRTMWQSRYFLFLIPEICFLSVATLNWISFHIGKIEAVKDKQRYMTILFCFILGLNLFGGVKNLWTIQQQYKTSANWIYEQNHYIFNSDTLILCSNAATIVEGWTEYYISRMGRRDTLNIVSGPLSRADPLHERIEMTPEMVLKYSRIYIVYGGVPSSLKDVLENNYDLEENRTDILVQVYTRK